MMIVLARRITIGIMFRRVICRMDMRVVVGMHGPAVAVVVDVVGVLVMTCLIPGAMTLAWRHERQNPREGDG